ncbi:MAG: hypothetical protein JWM85_775 [Acidimicrobiaceae bacterium]|nr:hypothetical protein [Acidimicrobiaceae bacterium]
MPTMLKKPPISPSELRRAVIYLRVSTNAQAEKDIDPEGYSLPAQREICRRKVEELGGVVVAEYIDRGESAKTTDRPEFQRLLAEVRNTHDADLLVVSKLDRWARNREDDVLIGLKLKQMRVQLASASENIDETPSGKLLRGLFSSINEWYSDNLAGEAIKGMTQKAKMGGTPGMAPIGYSNVRERVEGYEVRTIQVDRDRAPHIVWAYETYATGEWSLHKLTEELNRRGMRTVARGKVKSEPLHKSHVAKILINRYYLGFVNFRGVEYPGRHEPLIYATLFQRVQSVLIAHRIAGERHYRHYHYLKGSLFCGRCGTRMSYSEANGRSGKYPYFYCLGRHRASGCDQPYVPAHAAEDAVLRHHERIRPDPSIVPALQEQLRDTLEFQQERRVSESKRQQKRLKDLRHKRDKLLEAYFADAIPVDQLKAQQDRIVLEIQNAEDIIKTNEITLESVQDTLAQVMQLVLKGADLYRVANDHGRRLLNQFFFKKLKIDIDGVSGSEEGDVVEMIHRLEEEGHVKRAQAVPERPRGNHTKKNWPVRWASIQTSQLWWR